MAIVLAEDQTNVNQKDDGHTPTEDDVNINMDDTNASDHEPIFNSFATEYTSVDEEPVITVDIYNPRNWVVLITKRGTY